MEIRVFNILTDASGDFVGTLTVKQPRKLYAAQWIDGDLADGVDATLICTQFTPRTLETTLLTLTDANNDAFYYPLVTGNDGVGAAITDGYVSPLVHGVVELTVADGGNAKSGSLWLYLE